MTELQDGSEDEDADDEEDRRVDGPALKEVRTELLRRCKAAGIDCALRDESEGPVFQVRMPAGREKHAIQLIGIRDVQAFLGLTFETLQIVAGYAAICSYAEDFIECELSVLGGLGSSTALFFRRLLGAKDFQEELNAPPITLYESEQQRTSVSLGHASLALRLLSGRGHGRARRPAIKIVGANAKTNEEASAILERIANALLFQVDLTQNIPIALTRRRGLRRPRINSVRGAPTELVFPRSEFDREPLSLYWYGRSASGMPLLEFLAYYQAIEFYFPTYSQAEARRKIRNVLKNPTFRPERDADVARVLLAAQSTGSGFGDERSQLRATLHECLEPGALRSFFTELPERAEHFSSKIDGLTAHKIPVKTPDADLRTDVADRIYDIRCKIVHTKSGGKNGNLELLLPFSAEADLLYADIELARYVAREVLISAASPLTLKGGD